ncbi:ATP-binding cassette sub-family A member 17-like [Hippopotamus amphibius kiboko]|uniref:ATP-binding cassette sub-family A member 17-like n=1 Tax=Hippopotamus amphibius kiboko TaxID=575201 RepID=UPI0025970A0F|nr:ATP-binding cassette sub-family A member 17-like [Hippopotamus amphibius kiboko]
MTMLRNLKLLLWKNFILKKRKTLVTVLEILMPLLFSAIVMYLRFGSLPRNRPPIDYCAIDITSLPGFFNLFPLKNRFQLVYIPSRSETLKNITERVEKTFDVEFEVLGYPSVPLFENYIIQDPKAFYVLTGIVFDYSFNDSKEPLPLEVKYYLRFSCFQRNYLFLRLILHEEDFQGWKTAFLYPPNLSQEPRDYGISDGGSPGYNKEGFLAIQHATDKAIMWHHAPNETTKLFESLNVLLKRFPHGAYVQDSFFLVLQNEFPLFLMLSFICIELTTINSIALEKERKLKGYMCMMGLHNWQHRVAWFIMFFISAFVVVSFMTILFCTEVNNVAVFKNSDPSLIFVFLLCFAIATIFFAFMISTFFQKAHVATASGGIIFFFTYLPYLYLTFSYNQRSHFQKIAFCLLSNVAMALGVRLISTFETKGTGIQWRNIGSIGGEFNFTQVLLMLLLDSLLYGLVAWYVESVFPGEYGTPKPWYFFLMPSYWCGESISLMNSVLDLGDPQKTLRSKFIQEEPTDLIKGIEIQHLYKVFYKGRDAHMAVRDLTMNLYRGQITVLLGHNGAGKTTTCSVLTGLISPSSGQVYINGYEISQDMLQIRKSMGWCPQHDILFDNLTVAEHLYFYAQLKGLSRQKCPEEVKRMLHVLSLEDKQDSWSRFLSGGMRRKLSIGIALIAGSKVLILDEPTSGVDAISRRAIWDLLQQHKSDRTILLTTHFMDEADLLGDRIAIMAKGELQCCGSSLFLKQKYGAGYYMTLVKKPDCDTEKISHLIYQHIPNAIFQSSTGEEITFILPKESMHRFESLFTDLELRQEELDIASFGASVTTMEEVFIRVSKLVDSSIDMQIIKLPSFHSHPLVSRVPVDRIKRLHSRIFSIRSGLPIQPNTGFSLLCQQFYAMFLKRATYSWRNWMMMLSIQILVPLVILIVSFSFLNFSTSVENVPLELTLKTYGQTIVPFFISPNSRLDPQLSERFTDMLMAEGQIPLQLLSPVEPFLLKKLEEEPEVFDQNYLVAASFEDVGDHTIVTALFNNQAYHSTALALALVDNVLFKLLSGARASITVFNHPQPQSNMETSENILYEGPKGHYLVINLLFGMAFLSSSLSILTVKERSVKSKQVQFISGVYVATFWLSALLWDLISFLIPTLLLLVLFLYYNEEAFTHPANIPAVVSMLMLYAWAIIPFIYLTSFCFDSAGSACVKLIITLTFLSIGPLVLVSVTSEKDVGYTLVSESLDHTFLPLPGHCLGMAFSNLYYNFELQKFCSAKSLNQTECNQVSEGYVVQENIYAWESLGTGKYLTALAISGSVYLILLFLIETNVLWELKAKFSGFYRKQKLQVVLHGAESVPGDQDVEEEAKMVETFVENLCKKNPLVLKEVSKVYANKVPPLAVNKISFTVQAEECFGLLGLNGAGKTSIFKMLTGEEPITSGDAFVNSLSISSDLGKVRQWIGYCPQFDALLDHMTGKETLVMYARLRGIPERHISACVDQILDDLLMHTYADNLVKTYSGGNKRKLSAGIALLGEPTVIFLDEPSTGMDPMARRLLWGTVARARKSGKAIIITSHSMEECEALCTRLAIMVQGQFKCLGSPQHLKSKFGSGYSLWAKIRSDGQQEALEEFKAFVDLTFPGSVLEDEHQGMVHYHLPSDDLSWAKVFGIMEEAKKKYMLEDYSVNQVSLEDIFLSFTCPAPPTQRKNKQGKAEPAGPSLPSPPPTPSSSQPPTPPPFRPSS